MAAPSVQQSGVDTVWRKFTNYVEDQRLSVLEARIERRKRILADDIAERRTIMMRCIKRARRADGRT